MNILTKLAVTIIFSLTLAACGGGDDDSSSTASGTNGSGTSSSGSGSEASSDTDTGSSNSQSTYTVTPSVSGTGGTISPSVPASVQSGATTSFTLKPNSGYTVSSVSGTCGGSLGNNNIYTTNAITTNCTVVAIFATEGNTGGGSGSSTLTLHYEALPSLDDAMTGSITDFLKQINGEGAKGYRYLSDEMYSDGSGSSIFVNDGTAPSYTYELIADPGNATDLVTQANTEGAKGYRYEGPLMINRAIYSLYRQDNGSSATYTYAADPSPTSTVDWLAQTNGRGQSGYWLNSPIMYGSTEFNLYMKNNASSATYTYDALTPPTDLLAQLNSEGAKGYRAKGEMYIGGKDIWLYIKDQTQSATFTYLFDTRKTISAAPFIDQANSHGAQNYAYFSDITSSTSVYFKASNCSGFLCTALNPLIQN